MTGVVRIVSAFLVTLDAPYRRITTMRRLSRPILLAGVGLAAAVGTSQVSRAQQGAPPQFRSRVDLVEIDFVATDAANRPVLDLRKDELQVLEDDKLREIASISLVNVPLPPVHPPYAHDVGSNEQTADSRLFFLVLDDVHTLRERTESVKAVAKRFIERLSPGDELALIWVSMGNIGAREFTTNHAAVLDAIDRFAATDTRVGRSDRHGIPLPEFVDPDDWQTPGATALAGMNIKGAFDRSRPFMMVNDLCSYLATVPHRRKAVVFVGSGPTDYRMREHDPEGVDDRDILDFTRAVTAARRANVAVYMLDPATELRPGAPMRTREVPAEVADAPRLEGQALLGLARASLYNGMAMLSAATGGFDSRGPGVLAAADRVVSDTGTYYLLGYYADPPTGKAVDKLKGVFDPFKGFHSIEVRTTRPGVTIRARKGYWSADLVPEKKSTPIPDPTTASIVGVLPEPSFTLRALAVPLRGTARGSENLAVVVEAATPPSSALEGENDVEMLIAAVLPGRGVRATERARVRLPAAPSAHDLPRYRLCARLVVPPGFYQIRIGVRGGRAEKAASVYTDVAVPDFHRNAASLSGLLLERRPAPQLPTISTRSFANLVSFSPTLDRSFESQDEVWARIRVYRGKSAEQPLLRAALRAAENGQVWGATAVQCDAGSDATIGTDCRLRLPLDTLPVGTYRLEMVATNSGNAVETRVVDFQIR